MTVPLCQDCRFYRPSWGPLGPKFTSWVDCRHPSARTRKSVNSPVTGVTWDTRRRSCDECRRAREPGLCGPAGVHFVARRISARQYRRRAIVVLALAWIGYVGLVAGIIAGIDHLPLRRAAQQLHVIILPTPTH